MTKRLVLSLLIASSAGFVSGREWHVAVSGHNEADGSAQSPLRTISVAAQLAEPGDTVTVHAGVYRERVAPPRGGTSAAQRIVYQAAPSERVVITGSEPIKGWQRVTNNAWRVTISNSFFGKFNPYSDRIHGDWFSPQGRQHHSGAVYLNGHWLTEAGNRLEEVLAPAGKQRLWIAAVDTNETTICAQFPDVNPNEADVEINVRQTVFTPEKPGIDYITVRGFILRNAATPWSPPTAGQIGLVSAYWCKGWIIESNDIAYSRCSGVALGKYADEWDNRAESAEGYVGTLTRALSNGWNKATVGSHMVCNNRIHHCEQTGIVGSLGCSFSTITGNDIHDIYVLKRWSGAEMAGIKFHGAIDVLIQRNHIHRSGTFGIWLDWMAQGTHVVGNFLHDNQGQDLFMEVDHGPFLVANNLFLSPHTLMSQSQGGAFVHNLIAGDFYMIPFDSRQTPLHKAHTTDIAGLHDNPCGDSRYYNNLFVQGGNIGPVDKAPLPSWMAGNVFTKGTRASTNEVSPLLKPDFDPKLKLAETPDGWYLEFAADATWAGEQARKLVTTELLGRAKVPDLPFEQADGMPIRIDTDYLGAPRKADNPFPGPLEITQGVAHRVKVWPLTDR